MNWPEDRSRLIADAYELRGKKGVAFLSRMGSFDLWRGSLALMRGDSPNEAATETPDAANTERFLQALSVSRAIDRGVRGVGPHLRFFVSLKSLKNHMLPAPLFA